MLKRQLQLQRPLLLLLRCCWGKSRDKNVQLVVVAVAPEIAIALVRAGFGVVVVVVGNAFGVADVDVDDDVADEVDDCGVNYGVAPAAVTDNLSVR